ncbi:UvrD-helicase domain-containing protein [Balneolales bacterium ANBcel1]|nr:UvrD-helicase domain-containing protein [Balneolales bacterium ANBcel1]
MEKMTKGDSRSPAERTEQIRKHRGHMILEAGAGTGKTYSLTERVIHQLVERNVPLERMLALTFTDFAAAEMRARIYKAVNEKQRQLAGPEQVREADMTNLRDRGKQGDTEQPDTEQDSAASHQFNPQETGKQHAEAVNSGNAGSDEEQIPEGASPLNPELEHLQQTRRRFSKNYISTFHSFCNRILHYFPDELAGIEIWDQPEWLDRHYGKPNTRNVEGSFELLGEYDEVLWMQEWRKEFYRKYKAHPGLQRQLSRLSVADFEKFMRLLAGLGEEVLRELAELSPERYISKLTVLAGEWQAEKEQMERSLIEDFRANPQWFRKPDKRPLSYDEMLAIRTKSGFHRRHFDKDAVDPEVLDEVVERGKRMFESTAVLEKVARTLARPGLAQSLAGYTDQGDFDPDMEAYWNMRDLAELALRWHRLIRYMRFDAGCFNYDDMIWLTHTLFENNPDVAGQVRQRFDQILVDEFQDTDSRQWDIIRKIGFDDTPAETGQVPKREVLIVGDVKQAIYAFRGGDVAMMHKAHRDLAAHSGTDPAVVPLDWSFRSNPAIIGFANRLFRQVFETPSGAASYEAPHQPLKTPDPKLSKNAGADGEVRVLRTDYKTLKGHKVEWSVEAEALAERMELLEARRIARFLRQIHDGKVDKYQRITGKMRAGENAVGILYRRRKHFGAMEQALQEVGLTCTVGKGAGFFARSEINDVRLLLAFLLDAYDDVSLTGLLRSPMVSLSDEGLLAVRMAMDAPEHDYPNFWSAVAGFRDWAGDDLDADDLFALSRGVPFLENLRKQVPVRRVSELVEQAFFTDGPWLGAYADDSRTRENLMKLLDVIRSLESGGRGTLFEITGFLSDRIEEEASEPEAELPDPAPIRLMTIHGSKGLQFPMVVIPDMYAGSPEGGVKLNIAPSDGDSSAWPSLAYKQGDRESGNDTEDSFINIVLRSEARKRNAAEMKRLLYVAVTRAETHLMLSLAKPANIGEGGTFAELIKPWLRREEEAAPDARRTGAGLPEPDKPVPDGPPSSPSASGTPHADLDAGQVVICDLTPDELEMLAMMGYRDKAGKAPSGGDTEKASDHQPEKTAGGGAEAMPERSGDAFEPDSDGVPEPDSAYSASGAEAMPVVIDRDNERFRQVDQAVSSEIKTASEGAPAGKPDSSSKPDDKAASDPSRKSGDRADRDLTSKPDEGSAPDFTRKPDDRADPEAPQSGPENAESPAQWIALSPADAGTLVHRTLEMGLVDAAPDIARAFWQRELLRMGYANPDGVARDNSDELMRHCRNAVAWLKSRFSEPLETRFEVAFDLQTRENDRTVTIRGSIDMILRDRDGNDHIVDFKTGPVDTAEISRHVAENGYDRQVAVYRNAYIQLTGKHLPESQVWLLFTAPDEAEPVSLPDISNHT